MEPRGLLAEWDAQGRLTVLGAAKVPFFNRDTLTTMLGLPQADVDLIENDVGGGFGAHGEFYPEDFPIPFAAPARRPRGAVDRGPPRALDRDEPCASGGLRGRDRLPPRRHLSPARVWLMGPNSKLARSCSPP
jgi:hypothetical protein